MPDSDFIPDYLKPFIANQDSSLYTPIDHASWRFILRVSKDFFSTRAHEKYLNGLKETGVSTERIPLVSEMDAKLKRFGWRAVAVNGFIPPAVFMEFQSLGILPIACEMRTLEHLAYTPAPDIVHEAAGHAPIIADPEYSAYLRAYGEISRKAIFSYQDMAIYEAVRNLSVAKEDPRSTEAEIECAQKGLDEAAGAVSFYSEATLMARMNWWTVEYGLVGSVDDPRIYGAGLLSSLGESYHCLGKKVQRRPLTLDCIQSGYDITKPQTELFVTPDFAHLTTVLHEFAKTMAYQIGGATGLARAKEARTVCSVALDSGIQISGVLAEYGENGGYVNTLRFSGPCQLSLGDQELKDQGPEHHPEGFSTILGPLKKFGTSPSDLTDEDLKSLTHGEWTTLHFESGITVHGKKKSVKRAAGKIILLSFTECKATAGSGEVLFDPAWGTFDLACGSEIESVFGGSADRKNYLLKTGGFHQLPMKPKCNLTEENRELNSLYASVREIREELGKNSELDANQAKSLSRIEADLRKNHRDDWLLRLEMIELLSAEPHLSGQLPPDFEDHLRKDLRVIQSVSTTHSEMIERGLALLDPKKETAI
ncbi:MAG: aromatic amino acid hydroxylase [Cryobacterium sp.]|nr:aromatic amino acid hydroxylase [Oligoflexia bacterium]